MMRSLLRPALLAGTVAALSACGDRSEPGRPAVASVEVAPALDTLRSIGERIRLAVTVSDAGANGARRRRALVLLRSGRRTGGFDRPRDGGRERRGGRQTDTARAFGTPIRFELTAFDSLGAVVAGRTAVWSPSDTAIATVAADGAVVPRANCYAAVDRAGITVVAGDRVDVAFQVRCVGGFAYQHWRPDGYQLFYMDETGATRMLAVGAIERYSYRWSPDGSRLAFVQTVAGNTDLYVVRPDGTGLARLTNHPDSASSPSWSPDGKRIEFVKHDGRNYGVYTLDVDGGTGERPLTSQLWTASDPAWSLDGRHLLLTGIPRFVTAVMVMVMDADGSGVQVPNLSSDPDETPRVRPR